MKLVDNRMPFGTRVMWAYGVSIRRGTLVGFNNREPLVSDGAHLLSPLSNVYVDATGTGSWAWACEAAFAGSVLSSRSAAVTMQNGRWKTNGRHALVELHPAEGRPVHLWPTSTLFVSPEMTTATDWETVHAESEPEEP